MQKYKVMKQLLAREKAQTKQLTGKMEELAN
jgi:hypothetical protein